MALARTSMTGLRTVLGLALLAALLACGDGGGSFAADDDVAPDAGVDGQGPADASPDAAEVIGDPELVAMCGAVPQTLADWERCFEQRRCAWAVNCSPGNRYRDVEQCLAWDDAVDGLEARRRVHTHAIDTGRARIDTAAFAQCLVETSPSRCGTAFLAPSCATRLVGTVADDGACHDDVECASPRATCERDCTEACCEGVCVRAFRAGEQCDDFLSCEPGLQCNFSPGGLPFVCIAGDIGTACTRDTDCDPGAYCDPDQDRCVARLGAGAACDNILQCGGETMCVGLQRGAEPAQCRRVTEPGDLCDAVCLGNLACVLPTDRSMMGSCQPLAEPDQDCGSGNPNCDIEHVCSRQCRPRAEAGKSCGTCLPGLFCTGDLPGTDPPNPAAPVCAEPQTDGAPCNTATQCASRVCSGDLNAPGVCLPGADTCSRASLD